MKADPTKAAEHAAAVVAGKRRIAQMRLDRLYKVHGRHSGDLRYLLSLEDRERLLGSK